MPLFSIYTSVSICVFRFWFYLWLKLISANTCVPRIFSLTVVRCLHGVWGAGIQPAEADHSIQLPGNPYPQCQAHHQTGGSVAPGTPSSSSGKWVRCYWNNKLIIRQVSCYRSDQSRHQMGETSRSLSDMSIVTGMSSLCSDKQAIFVTGMSVVSPDRWVGCYRNVSVLLQECQCVVTKTSSSSSYRWVSCYRNVRQLIHGDVLQIARQLIHGDVLQIAISLIWINSHKYSV